MLMDIDNVACGYSTNRNGDGEVQKCEMCNELVHVREKQANNDVDDDNNNSDGDSDVY